MPHKSVVFLWCCSAFILAVGWGTYTDIDQQLIQWMGVFGVAALLVARRNTLTIVGCVAIAGACGLWRASFLPVYEAPAEEWRQFDGVIVREPEIRVDQQRLVVESDSIDGRIQVNAILHPRFSYGDVLSIGCTLRRPEPFDGFAYDKFLERHHISRTCSYPRITHSDSHESWLRQLLAWKQLAMRRFAHAVAPPENTVVMGALFGNKKAIPEELTEIFRRTGTSHLLVISGLHIGLLTIIVSRVLQWIALPRTAQTPAVIAFLAAYIALTGFQPSAVRASVFGGAVLTAYVLGRRAASIRVLVFAAAAMLAVNPLLLWHDVGFQLSFAATAGILTLHERIANRLTFLPRSIASLSAITIAATLTTAPLIVHHFQTFSPIGLLTNLVIVPLMPIVMITSIVVTGLALISQQLAAPVGVALYYLLHLFVEITAWFSDMPYASIAV